MRSMVEGALASMLAFIADAPSTTLARCASFGWSPSPVFTGEDDLYLRLATMRME